MTSPTSPSESIDSDDEKVMRQMFSWSSMVTMQFQLQVWSNLALVKVIIWALGLCDQYLPVVKQVYAPYINH